MLTQKPRVFTGCLMVCIGWANFSFSDQWDPIDDSAATTTTVLIPTLETQTHGTHFLDAFSDFEDWFKINLTAGTTYLFEGTGISDTEGFLYSDTSGTLVIENLDDGEEGYNFLIIYTTPSSGDYYLKVEGWLNRAAEYVLNYKIAIDDWDSGDDTGAGAASRAIDEYEYTEGPHSLTETDTNDWYRFSLTAGNTYCFESTGNWNTFGRLFSDAAGTSEVANDNNSGDTDNFKIEYMPTVSGDYYLQASQINKIIDVEYAKYDLTYRLIEDEWDSGDDIGTGGTVLSPIDETIRTHGPHALSSTDEYDWFKVHLVMGNTYRFESTGASDTEAFLYSDSAGSTVVANNDDFQPHEVSSNFQIIYSPANTGNYYLRITHSSVGNPAIYQLKYGIENDLDGDGMADAWEIAYLGGTNAQPNAHGDSDIQSNLEEYIAGTDPTNPASYFMITNSSAGSFVVEWPSAASREYRVYWADSLTNSFQQQGPVIDHPQSSYTDTIHNAESTGFYKVEVQLK